MFSRVLVSELKLIRPQEVFFDKLLFWNGLVINDANVEGIVCAGSEKRYERGLFAKKQQLRQFIVSASTNDWSVSIESERQTRRGGD